MAFVTEVNRTDATISGICISNLCFVDDISLFAEISNDLQQLVNKVHLTNARFGLKVSGSKTKGTVHREREAANEDSVREC